MMRYPWALALVGLALVAGLWVYTRYLPIAVVALTRDACERTVYARDDGCPLVVRPSADATVGPTSCRRVDGRRVFHTDLLARGHAQCSEGDLGRCSCRFSVD